MTTKKWVYLFGKGITEGNKELRNLLGGKGANLAEMSNLDIAVPPGFTVTTEACLDYYKAGESISEDIRSSVETALKEIEKNTNKKFGDANNPLLFSVRSGARVSMPGMMDTVLNLGLNNTTVEAIAKSTGNSRFAWDSYRRFIQMYSNVVLGINGAVLELTLEDLKEARGVTEDTGLDGEDLKELCQVYKNILKQEHSVKFPDDPFDQLWKAVGAVFGSWNTSRAKKYRELNSISDDWGTAVNVQSMVFGNWGEDSGTGVCFTRDPSTGEKKFFGEYLLNAQGEDVVAGIRTPRPINEDSKSITNKDLPTLQESMPEVFKELEKIYKRLESHYKDMQDIEFTIEKGKLYLLQTRNGKRTAAAGLKIAVDLVNEGVLTKKDAILRVNPEDLDQLLHPTLDPKAIKDIIAQGLPASPGAASGKIVFTSEDAVREKEAGKKVILVRQETSPEDIAGMVSSEGILTARGGMTSHAAVVARGMGKPCVAGCNTLFIDAETKTMMVKGVTFREGDSITIEGGSGEVIRGQVNTVEAKMTEDFSTFMGWVDEFKKLKVRANADNPEDAATALRFGAEGIGLCRTEHMFFDSERILAVREMIFASDEQNRRKALDKILPFQQSDFYGLFKVMAGQHVNIRLLDPPLHEFLPRETHEFEELAAALHIEVNTVREKCASLEEHNPMLGHRGCRLGITFPEIYEVQVKAILGAFAQCKKEKIDAIPEIMVPLISTAEELIIIRELIEKTVRDFSEAEGVDTSSIMIGTMIELPRAALCAAEIAPHADFFSFGTNDLTQTTFGISRDDAGKFLPDYVRKGIFRSDPFVSIDRNGVGRLVQMACEDGRSTNKNLHLGICGEHGGEPESVKFCHKIGLEYVSCSPYRVPIARLAAAQVNVAGEN
jgi:pyruvate,orthophosphate dikinase